jgi:hypothetical protein
MECSPRWTADTLCLVLSVEYMAMTRVFFQIVFYYTVIVSEW